MRKNKLLKLALLILTLLCIAPSILIVRAETYIEYTARTTTDWGLNIRSEPSSSSTIKGSFSLHSIFKYTDSDIFRNENDSCVEWIYVSSVNGYICKLYTEVISQEEINDVTNDMSQMTDEEFDAYLNSQGFNDTYKAKLKELHKRYPSWVFKGVQTNRDWNTTLNQEMKDGYNTYYIDAIRESAGQEAYLSTDSYYDWTTNMFYGYDGRFFLANKDTVAYYMDPRNYLNESSIFMFESLYFDSTYQNKDSITTLLGTNRYNDYIYNAGQEFNYSPIAVAIKIRQEGTLNTRVTSGTTNVNCTSSFTYNSNGTLYAASLYNFFNIGAYSSPTNADLNGLCYAAQTNENYFLPWNTEERAIKGGTKWIAAQYVNVGQYTNYFQKFNTGATNTDIGHQYMTNLEDPKSQASILRDLYSSLGLLRTPFVFYIPIYNNMPESTSLPTLGNPNNWLKQLTVKVGDTTNSVSNFSGDKTNYSLNVTGNVNSITINSTTVARTSYVSIDGDDSLLQTASKTVNLNVGENNFNIVVIAGNGSTKTYTLKITRSEITSDEQPTVEEMITSSKLKLTNTYLTGIEVGANSSDLANKLLQSNSFATIQVTNKNNENKTSGNLATGDKITITSKNETKTFEIVIFGDVNGDSAIDKLDYLAVLRHFYKYTEYNGVYKNAADANKDGTVDKLDYLAILRDFYGYAKITQ
ncbi:MAG: cadherin-like beta sandwich domain-containing protein [Bacilli bacterium]|nr:cadherin-like beta sandwich domain-containing protein [Bacilli bacterium]